MAEVREGIGREAELLVSRLALLGGPLCRLGRTLRLVRGNANVTPLGLFIGIGLWLVLVGLAYVEGIEAQLFSLDVIGSHVRLLVVIPLLFACETRIAPDIGRFVGTLVTSRIVAGADLQQLDREIARMVRLRDSWIVEFGFLLIAAGALPFAADVRIAGATWSPVAPDGAMQLDLAAGLYWFVCLTIFRFVLLRWVWRLALWGYLLWRIAGLNLRLVPTHPDRVGGLGYLREAQAGFTGLIAAVSATIAAAFAEDMAAGTRTLSDIYPAIAFILVLDAVLFVAPLYLFFAKLRSSRVKGLAEYMDIAARYVSAFDTKWLRQPQPDSDLLGSADLQSLADLGTSVQVIDEMQISPVSKRLLTRLALAALAPFVPLLLFVHPVDELAAGFFKALVGF